MCPSAAICCVCVAAKIVKEEEPNTLPTNGASDARSGEQLLGRQSLCLLWFLLKKSNIETERGHRGVYRSDENLFKK